MHAQRGRPSVWRAVMGMVSLSWDPVRRIVRSVTRLAVQGTAMGMEPVRTVLVSATWVGWGKLAKGGSMHFKYSMSYFQHLMI